MDIEPYDSSLVWLVVVGFVVAFFLAFGIGANDVANSFGTSVGAGVLTIFQACLLATVFEISGAILIGYKVSDTMRKGILDVSLYEGHEKELMLGALSSLVGSAIWLLMATALKLPISGTHSIVGAVVGFSLVCRGTAGIKWMALVNIGLSWFVSPMFSGIVSVSIFGLIRKYIIRSTEPLQQGLKALPLAYSFTIAINILSIVLDGPKLLYLDNVPWWASLTSSLVVGLITALLVYKVLVPWHRNKIELSHSNASANGVRDLEATNKATRSAGEVGDNEITAMSVLAERPAAPKPNELQPPKGKIRANTSASPLLDTGDPDGDGDGVAGADSEHPDVSKLFSFLQVLTAAFGSFAHGGNDVSNAIGPLIALWAIYAEGSAKQTAETPLLILLYGGFGISTGLWIWGRKVIETLGSDLAKITPTTGFAIEIGAAVTVLLASKAGLPISTTHCKVGSVVSVGYFSGGSRGVSWDLFRNIAFAWLITVPIAGVLSAACMLVFRQFLDD